MRESKAIHERKHIWRDEILLIVVMCVFVGIVYALDGALKPQFTPSTLLLTGVFLALVPAFIWVVFFYLQDRAEPEPKGDASAVVVFAAPGTAASERLELLLPDLPLETHRYTYTAWGCLEAGSNVTCSTAPATARFRATLKQALRGGGYALYFRHATATTCADQTTLGTASTTSSPGWWKRCDATCATATAAQLTPASSDGELAAISGFFADAGVAVGQVRTSEFCRAVQTAAGFQLDAGVVEQVPQLTYFVYEENNRCRDASSLLNGAPTQGTNTVLVGHGEFPAACAVLDSLNFAEAAIYKPTLGAPPRYLARVSASQWATLP